MHRGEEAREHARLAGWKIAREQGRKKGGRREEEGRKKGARGDHEVSKNRARTEQECGVGGCTGGGGGLSELSEESGNDRHTHDTHPSRAFTTNTHARDAGGQQEESERECGGGREEMRGGKGRRERKRVE
eukprot:52730-Rhodomonas_salina.1